MSELWDDNSCEGAAMEKISADLKLARSRKDEFSKTLEESLVLLNLRRKEFEDHFDSSQKSVEKRFEELQSKENELNSTRLLLENRAAKLDSVQKSVDKRFEELELKEKLLESKRLALEDRCRELDSLQECANESYKELEIKEKELHLLEESVQERIRNVNLKERLVDERLECLNSRERDLEERFEELNLKEEEYRMRLTDVEMKEKDIDERSREFEKSMKNCLMELELKERRHAERVKELGQEGKQCGGVLNSKVKIEQEECIPGNDEKCSASPNLKFSVTMDGRCLQIFLNEHSDNHESMRDEVFTALHMSSDPAKLVLDAMEGFYPPHTRKGDKEFEASAIRRSCILLLGQIARLSPKIRVNVKEEAVKLAMNWKAKMKVETVNSLEIFGFLQLVAAFKLVCVFEKDELFRLFQSVAQHRDAPELCRGLGFTDKIPDIIAPLVRRGQNLAAIRFIHAFDLSDKFPPVPILEAYYDHWAKIANQTCQMGSNLTKEQVMTACKSIAALKAVSRCIEDHKLQTRCLPSLKKSIRILKQKVSSKTTMPAPASPAEPVCQTEKQSATPAASLPRTQPLQQTNKRARFEPSESTLNAFDGADSMGYKRHLPHPSPVSLYLTELTPVDWHMKSYTARSPFLPVDAPREPGYYDDTFPYHRPVDAMWDPGFYEGPLPFDSPMGLVDEPDFYYRPRPIGGYELPPPLHPYFYS